MSLSVRIVTGISLLAATSVYGATVEATYLFNNSLNAQQGGAPALTATDPGGVAAYTTDTVYGQSRTVYSYGGSANPPTSQGGLTFDDSGGLIGTNSYSVELVFEFFDRDGAWRRILDTYNRQSDSGFYIDPGNNEDIYPVAGSATTFTTGVYHYVVLTNNGGVVDAYLDGTHELTTTTTVMNIDNNPGDLVNLFLDNTVAGGIGEWSSGHIALARFDNGALTAGEVAALANDPFPSSTVPEPSTLTITLLGAALLLVRRKR